MRKVSVVIPTMQKNLEVLNKLIEILDKDICVDEIILINNALTPMSITSNKLNIITPKENLFVNPSWNLGVELAKNEIVALFNDDIIISENFCHKIIDKMTPDMGIVGAHSDSVINSPNIEKVDSSNQIDLKNLKCRCHNWGITLFFYKSSYYQIPNELKIFFGDDWLFHQNKINGRKNYCIYNQKILHLGAITSRHFTHHFKEELKIYENYTLSWWQKIIYYRRIYGGFELRLGKIKLVSHSIVKNEIK